MIPIPDIRFINCPACEDEGEINPDCFHCLGEGVIEQEVEPITEEEAHADP